MAGDLLAIRQAQIVVNRFPVPQSLVYFKMSGVQVGLVVSGGIFSGSVARQDRGAWGFGN